MMEKERSKSSMEASDPEEQEEKVAARSLEEEFDDKDEWNPCMAGGVCLKPYAALVRFGSILEGPNPAQLKPLGEHAKLMMIKVKVMMTTTRINMMGCRRRGR